MRKPDSVTLKHGFVVAISLLLIGAVLGVPGSVVAQDTTSTNESVTTHVYENGDATLVVQLHYDLTDSSEQDAFESLSTDEAVATETKNRFTQRMETVAAAVTNETSRTVQVTETRISFAQENETGVVTLEADFSNLVERTHDDSLVLTEPFESGFTFDGTVRVVAPDGYVIESTVPSAEQTPSDGVGVWDASTSLDGFEVTMVTQDTVTQTQTPGMGVVVGLLSVVGAVAVVTARKAR